MGELVDFLDGSYEAYRSSLRRSFWELCARTLEEAARPAREEELRAHLVYNAGVLVRTRGALVAVDLGEPTRVEGPPQELKALDEVALALYSHKHPDHIGGEFLTRMKNARFLFPADAEPVIFERGADPSRSKVLEPGEEIEVGRVRVRASLADHMSTQIQQNLSYIVEQEGFRWCHLGDARDFSTEIPTGLDLLFVSVFLGIENEVFNWGLGRAGDLARMCAESGARCVVLVHLLDVARKHARAWRFFHAGLIKEMILSLNPHVLVRAPAPGEIVRLEK